METKMKLSKNLTKYLIWGSVIFFGLIAVWVVMKKVKHDKEIQGTVNWLIKADPSTNEWKQAIMNKADAKGVAWESIVESEVRWTAGNWWEA